jgi:hypothetical protein
VAFLRSITDQLDEICQAPTAGCQYNNATEGNDVVAPCAHAPNSSGEQRVDLGLQEIKSILASNLFIV